MTPSDTQIRIDNKKVVLCERKRFIVRCVASTSSVLLSYRGGGGGGEGTPSQDIPDLAGVHTGKDMGPVEVLWDGDGVPHRGCEQTDACENSTFPLYYVRGR